MTNQCLLHNGSASTVASCRGTREGLLVPIGGIAGPSLNDGPVVNVAVGQVKTLACKQMNHFEISLQQMKSRS
jgi:hypothetical protein